MRSPERQSSVASGNAPAATSCQKQDELRALLRRAPSGFNSRLGRILDSRRERFSRETSDRHLTFEYLDAAIALHTAEGRLQFAQELIAAAMRGWGVRAIAAGSVIRVFDENGQMVLRLEEPR